MWPIVSLLLLVIAGGFFRAWVRQRNDFAEQLATQAKEAEALREKHAQTDARGVAQQQALFNSMTEGVLLLDAAGRVQLVNEAFARLFSVAGDVRGRTVMEALRLHQVQALVNQTLIEGQLQDGELTLPGVEGDRFFAVNGAAVLSLDGQRQGMILVFHDLTRLKQLENTRREFVANVSHELRTPLSLIKGYVETLIDGARDNPEVALKFLHTIERHANRLTFLIEAPDQLGERGVAHSALTDHEQLDLGPVGRIKLVELVKAFAFGDQQPHARIADRVAQIITTQRGVERHPDRAGAHAAEAHQQLFKRIEQKCPDAVAGDDAAREQIFGNRTRIAVELVIGHGPPGDLGEYRVAMLGGLRLDQLAHRFPLDRPVAHLDHGTPFCCWTESRPANGFAER